MFDMQIRGGGGWRGVRVCVSGGDEGGGGVVILH